MQALLPSTAWSWVASSVPEVELKPPAPDAVSVQVATLSGGAARALRIELPAMTPPGSYSGVVRLPDGDRALAIDVGASPRLVAAAGALEVTAPAGKEAEIELDVANVGNVPYELPDRYGFGLFDVEGVDRSLSAGFTSAARGVDRVGVIADELAGSHGGVALVRVREGYGRLEPGASRTLRGSIRLGHDAIAGRTYFGYWVVQEGKCTVNVRVTVPALKEV
jgi:hypothetical protein